MKKKISVIFALWIAIFAIIIVTISITSKLTYSSNPLLLETEERIRDELLELTPIGASIENVLEEIYDHEEWEIRWIDHERGFNHPVTSEMIGEKSIRVFIGEYRKVFITSVSVYYGFDEDSKLITIYIWKDVNGI